MQEEKLAMMYRPKSFLRLLIPSRRSSVVTLLAASLLIVLVFALSACQSSLLAPSLPRPVVGSASPSSTTSTQESYPVKVYFSKFPDSLTRFDAVFPVDRVSPTKAVATFAIQLLIAGPTLTERSQGYFSELNSLFTGPSTCSAPYPTGGPDFKLNLNKKGSVDEPGTATLQFCRATSSPGIGADARVQTQITATLKQFPSIKKVVIFDKDGHCFADPSGQNRCLK
jgi:Sporulation and spore germination